MFLSVVLIAAMVVGGTVALRDLRHIRRDAESIAARDMQTIERLREENRRLSASASSGIATISSDGSATVPEYTLAEVREEALSRLGALVAGRWISASTALRSSRLPESAAASRAGFVLNEDGTVPPEFATFFGLDPSEAESLQSGLRSVLNQIEAAIFAQSRVTRSDSGGILVEIGEIAAMPELKAHFAAVFRDALGESRYQSLVDLYRGSEGEFGLEIPWQQLVRFGDVPATIEISRQGTRFQFSARRLPPVGGGTTGGAMDREELLRHIGPVAKLFPAN